MNQDFLNLSKTYNAFKSVVRAPDLDPKYKIAVLASKQVYLNFYSYIDQEFCNVLVLPSSDIVRFRLNPTQADVCALVWLQ